MNTNHYREMYETARSMGMDYSQAVSFAMDSTMEYLIAYAAANGVELARSDFGRNAAGYQALTIDGMNAVEWLDAMLEA